MTSPIRLAEAPEPAATPPLVAAGVASQVAAFSVCTLWLGLEGVKEVGLGLGALSVAALAVGIAVGLTTGLARRFVGVAGWVAATCTVAVSAVVISMLGFRGITVPRELSVVLGLFVLGLDWLFVRRLRAAAVLSGVFMVPLVAGHESWAVGAALVWFGGALATFWLLERDARAAVPRPANPSGSVAREDDPRAVDLLSLLVPALLIGAAAALLLGHPSCSGTTPTAGRSSSVTAPGGARPGGATGSDGGVGSSGQSLPGGPGRGSGNSSGSSAHPGGSTTAPAATPPAPGRSPNWTLLALVALLAVAVALVVGLVGWWLLRGAPVASRSWAETMADRLDREGARRGRPRRRDETVVSYSAALGSSVLADPRLGTIGQVVSSALFGPAEPTAGARAWTEAAVTEIVAAHPPPRRRDHRPGRAHRGRRPGGDPTER
ncbi:MAG TPA: hypothetical protein VIJ47_09730 [Acidimicrobiales bacterium]